MATQPPPYNDRRTQRRILRDQARMQRAHLQALRRSSLLGPLLAISVGVVFLLVQLGRISAATLLTWFARWWPLLLIGIGLLRLVEWGLDQRGRREAAERGLPYASRGMGFGLVVLVGLLTVTGVAVNAAQGNGGSLFFRGFNFDQDNLQEFLGEKHESDHTLITPIAPGSTLMIQNPHGDIILSGTSDDGQIHLQAHSAVYSRSDSDAAKKDTLLTPHVSHTGDQIQITLPAVDGGQSDLTLTVPATTPLVLQADHGEIRANSMHAPITLTSNHGDVELSAITGNVTAHVNHGDASFAAHNVTGDLNLEGRGLDVTLSDLHGSANLNGDFFGTVHLEHMDGPVKLHTSRVDLQFARLEGDLEAGPSDITGDQLQGPTVVNTRNRTITLERVVGDLAVTNRNGSVTVTAAPPLGMVAIENRNGEIDLTLPQNAQFSVQAETDNADIENDFGLQLSEDGTHPKLSGAVGEGGPTIHLSTSQADISLHRGSVAPLPPTTPSPPLTPAPASSSRRENAK